MKTSEMTEERANRALWAACMGNMGLAASWLQQANHYRDQGGTLSGFVASAHVSNRRQAKAAYVLAEVATPQFKP